MLDTVLSHIQSSADEVENLQRLLVSIPAMDPDNGGDGELAKCQAVERYLTELGFTRFERMDAPDSRVSCGFRPNMAAILPGKDTSRTFWIISHLDVVPPGDVSLWTSDPWTLVRKGDELIGRGVEDNHQALVSSVLVARALLSQGLTPPINLGLLCVADEETGSKLGLEYVINHHADRFSKNDLYLVPDFGLGNGAMIEVAEKSMYWLRITVLGKQCHASVPHMGVNSLVAASAFVLKLRQLCREFDATDDMFDPPCSTFEPTKKEANVENINTVPGRDVFYLDSRVLGRYPLEQVFARIKELGDEVAREFGVTIEYHDVQREQAAPATPVDAEVVARLSRAIREVIGVEPTPMGIGGGTVAAVLRRKGYQAAVWATLRHFAHQPNESSSIANTLNDAQVMARVLLES